jgi:hypothetical protein
MMLPPLCFTIGMVLYGWWDVPGFLCIQAKELHFCLIRPQKHLSYALKVFHMPFCKSQGCCHVSFSQEWSFDSWSPPWPRSFFSGSYVWSDGEL